MLDCSPTQHRYTPASHGEQPRQRPTRPRTTIKVTLTTAQRKNKDLPEVPDSFSPPASREDRLSRCARTHTHSHTLGHTHTHLLTHLLTNSLSHIAEVCCPSLRCSCWPIRGQEGRTRSHAETLTRSSFITLRLCHFFCLCLFSVSDSDGLSAALRLCLFLVVFPSVFLHIYRFVCMS